MSSYLGDHFGSSGSVVTAWTPSTGSRTVLAENAYRAGAFFFNDSSAAVYLKLGAGSASTGSYTVKVADQAFYELPKPVFFGPVQAVWATVVTTGSLMVTEQS